MFIKFHTYIKHHKTLCGAQQPYFLNMYFFSYFPLNKIMSVFDMKTVKDIFLKLHTNINYH